MGSFSREDILAQQGKVEPEQVPVPEWGDGTINLRPLGSASRLKWALAREKALTGEPGPDPTAMLIVMSAVKDDGSPLFQMQDCDWLSSDEIDGGVIDRLSSKVMELSGMTEKAAEESGKDSTSPSSSSPTDSPAT